MGQIAFYRELFKSRCNLEWTQILDISKEFQLTLRRLVPDLLDEIEGIAEGVKDSNVGTLDIIALNCRSEIALGRWTDGCTSLGWNVQDGPRKQFLAQNWDWNRKVGENLALMSIERQGKTIYMVTEVR
jgi:isopenicillin-N N-acyltransferase-like protein